MASASLATSRSRTESGSFWGEGGEWSDGEGRGFVVLWELGKKDTGKREGGRVCLPSLLPHPHAFAGVLPRTGDRDKFFLTGVSWDLAHMCPVHV